MTHWKNFGLLFLIFWQTLLVEVQAAENSEIDLYYLVVDESVEPNQIMPSQRSSEPGIYSTGIISDLLREVFTDSGLRIKEVYLPVKRIVQFVSDSNAPNWISYGSVEWTNSNVAKNTFYLEPELFYQKHSLVSLKSRHLRANNYEDLRGKHLVLISGYFYDFLEVLFQDYDVQSYKTKSHDAAITMIKAGRGDYYLADDMRARWVIKSLGMPLSDFDIQPFQRQGEEVSVSLTLKNTVPDSTKKFIESKVNALRDSGEFQRIMSRY